MTEAMEASEWLLRCFVVSLVFFHSSEFFLALYYHRAAGARSLLITGPYLVALTFGLVEHTLESLYLPNCKTQSIVTNTGLGLVIVGELIRKLAILTAKQNFTHEITEDYSEDHHLVTHGIYRYVRHPSYLGFFLFAVGTQVLLCNPIATVGYIIVLWRFFRDRIEYEEYFLVEFFGEKYEEYQKKVPSGIPFVK
ncbi:hypothetical protein R1flu_018741 [Riccia fluitans]|uniref:Protein-S-isoprenylcysteine O-methyltransferase n=1 Tax=Riccia fluitans TaxID=41844 RepID=A0ABD1ZGV9_9MARC